MERNGNNSSNGRESLEQLLKHPDIARAVIILGNAKEEAARMVRGDDSESIARRNEINSLLIDQIVKNQQSLNNGESSSNREIPQGKETSV